MDVDSSLPFFLPGAGGSSFNPANSERDLESSSIVSPKITLQYTCEKCETRNEVKMSRLAYRKGLVIARCKGCNANHLISDNLGWTNIMDGALESFMESQGRSDTISRVSCETFEKVKNIYQTSPMPKKEEEDDDELYEGMSVLE